MSLVPVLPDTAPFSPEQRAWLNGFLAGLFSRAPGSAPSPAAATSAVQPLTILFGSQTGTSESLAKKAAKEAGKRGFAPTVVDMAQMDGAKLSQEKNVLIITSTYGDGEPPDNAKALWTAVGDSASPSLAGLRYSVCALGDTNYTLFCQCGKDFDTRLEARGAARIHARVDCDLDYDEPFTRWLDASLSAFGSATSPAATPAPAPAVVAAPAHESSESGYSKKNPYPAPLLVSRNLNGFGSAKSVHHVEFSLEGSGLTYEAGDALGVVPMNCPELVSEVLERLHLDGEEAVQTSDGKTLSLRQALTTVFDLGKPTTELLAAVESRLNATVSSGGVQGGNGNAGAPMPQVIDVLARYPEVTFTAAAFTSVLKKLQPRLYSISSSPKAHPGAVHLTVGSVKYDFAGRARKGVCSTHLAERAVPGESKIGVFVHSNKAFRPPVDSNAPMIMVGPGTGIAPFRAFLEERAATGAKGKNWLLFGDQKAATDFLYRDQLEAWVASGFLSRLDTAFSRDQAEKIYVQNRMLEHAAELWAWLEAGAHFYVCGDASRMAKDVDNALHQVIERAGGKSKDQAAAYVQSLKASKRYARDVY